MALQPIQKYEYMELLVTALREFTDKLPLGLLVIACATLGLAPFVPEPHVWEKLKMLAAGTLTQPIDIGDFLMHGAPFALLALKLLVMIIPVKSQPR